MAFDFYQVISKVVRADLTMVLDAACSFFYCCQRALFFSLRLEYKIHFGIFWYLISFFLGSFSVRRREKESSDFGLKKKSGCRGRF